MNEENFIHSLCQVIYTYYDDCSQDEISQLVKSEVIPLLISLFFQSTDFLTTKTSTTEESVLAKLREKMQRRKLLREMGNQGENAHTKMMKMNEGGKCEQLSKMTKKSKKNIYLNFDKENISTQQISKLVGVCWLALRIKSLYLGKKVTFFPNCVEYIQKKREKFLFLIERSQYSYKKRVIKKFYSHKIFVKKLKKFCILNKKLQQKFVRQAFLLISIYSSNLSSVYALVAKNNVQNSLKKCSSLEGPLLLLEKAQGAKKSITAKGLKIVDWILRGRLRESWQKIRSQIRAKNPWIRKCIRFAALNSPINIENSLWRLKAHQKSNKNMELFVKKVEKVLLRRSFNRIRRRKDWEEGEIRQKLELFMQHIENYKQIQSFSMLMNSFALIERN